MMVEKKEQSMTRNTLTTAIVMGGTMVSRLLGFLRIAVIGSIFGANGQADVLNAVFTIPNNLRKLMAEGALSSAFIPVLSRAVADDDGGARPRRIVANILAFQLIVLVPLLILAVLFAQPIIRILLDFAEAARMEQAAELFVWIVHYLLLISVSALMMGALNAHGSFVVPAFTPILFSVFVIGSVLVFHNRLGIFSMALGVLCGGFAQIAFQYPACSRLGYGPRLDLRFRNADFASIVRLWLPVVATASIFSVNEQIAIRFATGLEDGSASAMSNALVFWQLPFGIFSASITTVLFPRMSRLAGRRDMEGLGAILDYGLSYLLILLVPSAVFMSIYAREIISVALQRGEFSAGNTELTARVLTAFNCGLFSVGAFTLIQRAFYSLQDYRVPLRSAVLVSATDVALSLILKETPLRVSGLAYANSISFTLGLAYMLWEVGRRIGRLSYAALARTAMKACAALLPAILAAVAYLRWTGPWWREGSSLRSLAFLALGAILFALMLVSGYWIAGIDIVRSVFRRRK